MPANKSPKTLLYVLASILCLIASAHAGLEGVGKYDIKNIYAIYTEDLNGDKIKDIIVVAEGGIYVLNSDASLIWEKSIENVKSVYFADIDGNGEKEILVSAGAVVNNIERGNFYIFDGRGRTLKEYTFKAGEGYPHLIYYAMAATDLDGNRYAEIIGGCSNGVYAVADTYDKIKWNFRTNETITYIAVKDSEKAGDKDIIAASYSGVYVLSADGKLKRNYTVAEGIKIVRMADVAAKKGDETILISQDDTMYVLDANFNLLCRAMMASNVQDAIAFDLTGDGMKEIVLGAGDGIYIINSRFMLANKYLTGEKVRNIYYTDWDGDSERDIVFGSGSYVYAASKKGEMKDKAYVSAVIKKLIYEDIDNDGYMDVVINSGDSIYVFENKQVKIKNDARENYISAVSFAEMGRYEESDKYLQEAIRLYSELGDRENLKKCEDLAQEIASKVLEEKKKDADSHYQAALRYFENNDAANVMDELSRAKQLYSEINDTEGVSRCVAMNERLKKKVVETPSGGGLLNVSSVFKSPSDLNPFPIFSIFLLVAIVMLLAILIVKGK